jgi:aminoglycoside phosphotransferase (APT) family kinase protein
VETLIAYNGAGWDSRTLLVARRWVLRVARRPEVAERYAFEAALLPELASLPLEVPTVLRRGRRWILTRYVDGTPWTRGADLRPLGTFLRELHALQPDAPLHDKREDVDRFRADVLPLLHGEERRTAAALLDEHAAATFEPVLTHSDLGPEHLLVRDRRAAGVIDWTDARLGDPAIDLAWALHAAPELAETYPVDEALARRALVYHALGPWHEVAWGLGDGGPRFVESGLAGVRARLARVAESPDTIA